jgi:hypothetical protein
MLKAFWTICMGLVWALAATNAHADTYTLDFTGPSPFTATFDATAGQVTSSVDVTFAGTTYILTNFFLGTGTGDSGCVGSMGTLEFVFLTGGSIPGCTGLGGDVFADPSQGLLFVSGLLEGTTCRGCPITNLSFFDTPLVPGSTSASAHWSGATEVYVPEPSTIGFLLCGLGLLGLAMRGRPGFGRLRCTVSREQ